MEPQDHNANQAFASQPTDALLSSGLTSEQVQLSSHFYRDYLDEHGQATRIGLEGEDLESALQNPDTILTTRRTTEGSEVQVPLLVPAENLSWYNMELLKRTYGEDTEFIYFAHPPVSNEEDVLAGELEIIQQKLDEGAVIFMDQYQDSTDTTASRNSQLPLSKHTDLQSVFFGSSIEKAMVGAADPTSPYVVESYGGSVIEGKKIQGRAEVFAGEVTFNGAYGVKEAASPQEVYTAGVEAGEFENNPANGVSMAAVIEGEEAERIWEIYKEPFDELSEGHPEEAGFTKEEVLEILADAEQFKIVNRVDGKISTICMFVDDFELNPWFNRLEYDRRFPDYVRTNNVLMFPGIVSDKEMRGQNYSWDVISLALEVYARRGSNVLVTFDCTEISTTYIPDIVEGVINSSEQARISSLQEPISITEYRAVRLAEPTAA